MNDSLHQAARQLRHHIHQFVALSDEEWHGLEPHLSIVHLKKKPIHGHPGGSSQSGRLCLEGVFRQFYTKDGEELTTYFFFDQQLVAAYMSCITARPSPVSIEALSDATCLVFPYPVLKALFSQYAGWQEFGRLFAEYVMVALEERMA